MQYNINKVVKFGLSCWVVRLRGVEVACFMSENGARDYVNKNKRL